MAASEGLRSENIRLYRRLCFASRFENSFQPAPDPLPVRAVPKDAIAPAAAEEHLMGPEQPRTLTHRGGATPAARTARGPLVGPARPRRPPLDDGFRPHHLQLPITRPAAGGTPDEVE